MKLKCKVTKIKEQRVEKNSLPYVVNHYLRVPSTDHSYLEVEKKRNFDLQLQDMDLLVKC